MMTFVVTNPTFRRYYASANAYADHCCCLCGFVLQQQRQAIPSVHLHATACGIPGEGYGLRRG